MLTRLIPVDRESAGDRTTRFRVPGHGSWVTGHGTRVTGHGTRVTGHGREANCLCAIINLLSCPSPLKVYRVRVYGLGFWVLGLRFRV